MSVETIQQKNQDIADRLQKIRHHLVEQDDRENALKLQELQDKWLNGEFVLAFCGHFSAGKSTMINTLMGREILPSSPIPTSANVVLIKTGESKAIAYFQDQAPRTFDYVGDLERLKEYCKDGDAVTRVEISCPNDFLVNNARLMDTPGIDSTDAAHKVATESAMHLADVVVYMMDYNHVQSEINFQFTKTLKDKGKTLFLVVNQIDKHFDMELDFSAFQQSVEDAFKSWGVEADGIFYTTLKYPEHPHNQLEDLHDRLYSLFCNKDQLLQDSVIRSVKDVLELHDKYMKSKNGSHREQLQQKIGSVDEAAAEKNHQTWQQEVYRLQKAPEIMREQVMKKLQAILASANLTPFQIRELAQAYMESCQPGFKVGFLFTAAAKTKQAQEDRLNAFRDALQEQVKAHLRWHILDLFSQTEKEYSLKLSDEFRKQLEDIEVEITPQLLSSVLKKGAQVTGEAVLNYTHDLAAEVKQRYRRLATEFIDQLVVIMQSQMQTELEKVKEEEVAATVVWNAWEQMKKLEQEEQSYISSLEEMLVSAPPAPMNEEQTAFASRKWPGKSIAPLVKKGEMATLALQQEKKALTPFKVDYKAKLGSAAGKLKQAADVIEDLRGQALAAKNMRQRADRLEQNLFTVALFGAFSAGKSSFANAMMGEMILPVSPNPTTATINKILPPTERYPHGSVRVKVKSKNDMEKDVLQSLSIFGLQATTLEEAVQKSEQIRIDQMLPSAKPHYSFLRAVKKGLGEMSTQYGQELLVGMDEFKDLVAKEEKACFVEWIDLYYSCPLTDQGVSLVDTPGADSINARHTGVAFDYIKNADAILFVTYYNHAFSHADREFLQQLGRVKDTMEMDKMFFIVNAADLAKSEEELENVVQHVKENLVANGIRQPRLYPVSSQTALLARMLAKNPLSASAEQIYRERTGSGDTLMKPEDALVYAGFKAFEEDFIQFTFDELTEVAYQSALGEIKRSEAVLQSFIQAAQEGEEARKIKRNLLHDQKREDQERVLFQSGAASQSKLEKEAEELVYYVKQRLQFKLGELFSLSFNPAVLNEEAIQGNKKLVEQCFDEFIRHLVFNLEQEMRATSLRMEKFVNHLLEGIWDEKKKVLSAEILVNYAYQKLDVPELPVKLPYEKSTTKGVLAKFKSPKQFFEQGGREQMRSSLEEWMQQPVSDYLAQASAILRQFYGEAYDRLALESENQLKDLMEEYYAGMLFALEEAVDIASLETKKDALEQLLA